LDPNLGDLWLGPFILHMWISTIYVLFALVLELQV
jgi:hypothetical protein